MIRRLRGTQGFTLIEILVVVTIIVMAFGFALPTINRFMSDKKVKSVTGRMARGLLSGRMKAITKHHDVYVFFLRDRLMIVSARPETPEFFPYFTNESEKVKITLAFRFADVTVKHDPKPENAPDMLVSDLPALPPSNPMLPESEAAQGWSAPQAAKAVLQGLVIGNSPVYLLFKSEGTVEFGSAGGPGDILPMGFWATPPIDADIIIHEEGNASHGWIDIRATGNVDTRIADGTPDLRPREKSAEEE